MLLYVLYMFIYVTGGFAYGKYLDNATRLDPASSLCLGITWVVALPIHIAFSLGIKIGELFTRIL